VVRPSFASGPSQLGRFEIMLKVGVVLAHVVEEA
jgi:hypothetical protein